MRSQATSGIRHSILAIVVSCVTLMAAATQVLAQESIKIGVVDNLTGPVQDLLRPASLSITLAVEEINQAGGVKIGSKRYKLELVREDGGCNPTNARAAYEKLITREQVVAVIGNDCSGGTLAGMPVTQKYKVAHLTAMSSPKITEQGHPSIFRARDSDASRATLTGKLWHSLGRKVTLMISDNGWGRSSVKDYEHFRPEFDVLNTIWIDPGANDFYSQLTAAKRQNPDILHLATDDIRVTASLLKQARELGINAAIVGSNQLSEDEILRLFSNNLKILDGVYSVQAFLPDMADSRVQAFVKAYRARFPGQVITYIAPITYDIVYILKAALERLDAVDREKLIDAVRKTDMAGAYGGRRIHFDGNGQAVGMSQFVVRWQGGRREIVYRAIEDIPAPKK